ncbi:hypothetical protein SAMN04487972_10932 [Paracoccus halophilus]|uniref:Uncharacterized protein n=1 Tax=Paracoccus halophilus TaxID=376733 RepID=A0A1I0TJX5_9RHOB|nr:hypothetical protein [Paracoccus halophilus]SFA51997.1 hypothetical protein SAMN04487972_10932 [Paracoccus halophilus]
MIGQRASGRGWLIASALSVAVHLGAAGALIWSPSWRWTSPGQSADPVEIQLTALTLPGEGQGGGLLRPVSQPIPAPRLESTAGAPTTQAPDASPLLQSTALPMAPAETAAPAPPQMPAEPRENPAETDPDLADLFQRIRDNLTEPCLLALPALTEDGQIRLSLLASDDEEFPRLLRNLTQGLETELTGQAVLIDPRQCPALTFARRDLRYPVFPLAVQLQSQDVAAGDSLRGTISGATGRYVTLLLVDDNGVTHDLRRFLINSGGRISFDVPVARDGAARDTHQLILAVATPARPATISRAAGEPAGDFFDQLARELGRDALIGVANVYIR